MRSGDIKIPVWLTRRRFSPLVQRLIAERIAARPLLVPEPPAPEMPPLPDNVIPLRLCWAKEGRWAMAPSGLPRPA